ncbi:MAG: ATPase [Prevotella sp.]|jgi:N-acetylglucosamine kinase-like BadF-type ATPase
MTILIADSGSTKTDWTLVDSEGSTTFHTQGLNPVHSDLPILERILKDELKPQIGEAVDEVYFYGAGCMGTSAKKMAEALKKVLGCNAVEVESDLVGAARALFGHCEGIACILGTGSNSGLYDGKDIVANIHPLGYILGDEGSGASIGKHFLNALYKGRLSKKLEDEFVEETGLNYENVIEKVYRQPLANRFLASLVGFVSQHRVECKDILSQEFDLFIKRNVEPFMRRDLPVGIVGGIGYEFQQELKDAFTKHEMRLERILRRPIDGLVEFHCGMKV